MAPVIAEVRLHGRRVGELRYDRGSSEFRYEDDVSDPDHRTLGQIFEDEPRTVRRARVGVPAWFANLLPEGALRRQIVQEMGGGNIGNFTLLLRLGRYLPGAVSVHSDTEPPDDVAEETAGLHPEHPLRHSLAGVQLKYSVSTARLTFPVSGNGGWWIVKLPDPALRDLPLNEYLTMTWLSAAGFAVPPVHLVPARAVEGIPEGQVDPADRVFVVERFDRTRSGRVHVEDFAQVADVEPMFKYSESGATYDGLASVIRQLTGDAGYLEYIRRLAAMLVTGNTDAHLKNWALIYPDGRTPALAPVYDFHSLSIYQPYRYAPLALGLNAQKIPSAVGLDDFRRLAERCDADPEHTVAAVIDAVSRLRAAWQGGIETITEERFPALAKHVAHRLRTLPVASAG